MRKTVTALIVPMPSVPLKPFPEIKNLFMARITWSPLTGSVPSKLFVEISNPVTALIARMPLSGIAPLK
eukprot:6006207-Amphidinium_carterae.1